MSDREKQEEIKKVNSSHFIPGVSGNPAGRPKKGNALAEIIREIGEQTRQGDAVCRREKLALRMWDEALSGDGYAATWIRDTGYGKPAQVISGDAENPLTLKTINLKWDDDGNTDESN
jgi:hypothetical protein